jgi:hypothetical protein
MQTSILNNAEWIDVRDDISDFSGAKADNCLPEE